jgi:hypothetical protein
VRERESIFKMRDGAVGLGSAGKICRVRLECGLGVGKNVARK